MTFSHMYLLPLVRLSLKPFSWRYREAEIEHDDGQQEQQLGVAYRILLPTLNHFVLSMP